MIINGVNKIESKLSTQVSNKPKDLKHLILSWIDDEEISSLPLEDLYSLLETRCRLYNGDYDKGCEIIYKRRLKLVPLTKEEKDEKRRIYQRKNYIESRKQREKRFEIRLNMVEYADVIKTLEEQPNRTEYLVNLIRADKKH